MVKLAVAFFALALAAAYFGGFGGVSDHAWQGATTAFIFLLLLCCLAVVGRVLKWPYG